MIRFILGLNLCIATALLSVLAWLAWADDNWFLTIVFGVSAIDITMTLIGRPLFGPGPFALFMHPGLREDPQWRRKR